jgi:prepilin-type N-terminal cleavage/methylation domain-containing protein
MALLMKGQSMGVGGRRDGFTLAELIVASVVTTVALLGINGLFFHAMDVEARSSVRWTDGDTSEAVLDRLATTIESATNLPDIKTIVVNRGADGSGWLICQTPIRRVQYHWRKDEDDGKYTLTMQVKAFAGTRDLTTAAPPDEEAQSREKWDAVPAMIIASALEEVSVQARPLGKDAKTKDGCYEGPSGKVAIHLKVIAGGQTASGIVLPRCDANPQDSQEGDNG